MVAARVVPRRDNCKGFLIHTRSRGRAALGTREVCNCFCTRKSQRNAITIISWACLSTRPLVLSPASASSECLQMRAALRRRWKRLLNHLSSLQPPGPVWALCKRWGRRWLIGSPTQSLSRRCSIPSQSGAVGSCSLSEKPSRPTSSTLRRRVRCSASNVWALQQHQWIGGLEEWMESSGSAMCPRTPQSSSCSPSLRHCCMSGQPRLSWTTSMPCRRMRIRKCVATKMMFGCLAHSD